LHADRDGRQRRSREFHDRFLGASQRDEQPVHAVARCRSDEVRREFVWGLYQMKVPVVTLVEMAKNTFQHEPSGA